MPRTIAGEQVRSGRQPESGVVTALLVGLVAIAPVSIDMFLPSMPDMAREFETSTGSISLAVTLISLFSPSVSVLVAGLLHDLFGWHSVFVTLLAVGGILIAGCLLLLPEIVLERDLSALSGRRMAANYRRLLSSPVSVSHVLMIALLFSGPLVFISSSWFVLIDELGLTPRLFGLGFGFVAFGIMAGAAPARRPVGPWPPARIRADRAGLGLQHRLQRAADSRFGDDDGCDRGCLAVGSHTCGVGCDSDVPHSAASVRGERWMSDR